MAERNIPTDLKNSLIDGDPYSYFHLVKFEKPRPSAGSGQTSGKAIDYAYITDASINIVFDDASVDSRGSANLPQTYVANKLLSVGTVSETTEAKASSISLTLSGTALGTIIIANTSFTSSSMTADIDLLEAGFQEGDTLLLESATGVNNNKYVRIDTFTNNNQTVSLTPVDTTIIAESAVSYNLSYASEEVNSLILNKVGGTNYSNYINREAYVYRAHMNPETGIIIGAPFLIFRGIIAKGAVSDNMLTTSKISWSLTSHWGDFVRVQGRQTSDAQHRALSVTGEPDVDALIRPEYAQDPGFVHAESSVNVMAQYQTIEKKFRMRKRGGFAGVFGGTKMLEYTEVVDKEIDLQFNLEAKYLPVIYGVQKVDSFPIFADIKAPSIGDSSTEVYIAHAICEGEISGILDIYIDDSNLICLDASDSDVRATGGENVDIACYGRADRGDVLSGGSMFGAVIEIGDIGSEGGNRSDNYISGAPLYQVSLGTTPSSFGGTGLRDGDTIQLQSPLTFKLDVHAGKADQRANNTLVNLARSNSFKIQQDYYSGVFEDYWSTSHRLLDTAYAVGKYTINEGETTIPKLEFVVKGSTLECYNYDYSYLANDTQPDGGEEDFLLGDLVTLHHTVSNLQIGASSITIIDKWAYYDEYGNLSYRFRYSDNPQAAENVGNFYMKNATGDKWYMSTYDALELDKVAIPVQPEYEIASAALNATGTWLNLFLSLSTPINIIGMAYGTPVIVSFPNVLPTASFILTGSYSGATGQLPTVNEGPASEAIVANIAKGLTPTLTVSDRITLGTDASPVDDHYNNKNLTLTRYINDVIVQEVTRRIVDYNGATKIAILDSGLPPFFIPDSTTDVISISSRGDKRVSINPAIQLLDYLTNIRYGKGLKQSDLNLSTFLDSAGYCDTRSDVIVQVTAGTTIAAGDVYKYEVDGALTFQGKVKSVVPNVVNIAGTPTIFQEITFTDVIGKLAYKWNNWKAFPLNYPIWNNGLVYLSSGTVSSTPPTSGEQSSLALIKVTGSGVSSLSLSITDGFTSSGNPIIKKFTNSLEGFNSPGYSLYDSDDVKYWAYLGWDEPTQRCVTRHQTNQVINTSSPLFDNINSMLLQFNGIMRYSNGKYELDIKRSAPEVFETYQVITEGDIFGELKVSDKGQKNTYNSMETSIIDPQNKFSGRGIKFFNSNYLKEDKGIRRAGNFAMPGISNYYNARINIKQYLDTSRYGLDIDFTIDSKGYLLLAGTIIKLSYDRFGWVNKLFRIENLNFNTNGLVQVTASEHNDEAFLIGDIRGTRASRVAEEAGGANNQSPVNNPVAPSNLQAATNAKGGITVTWNNSANFKQSTHTTELYASATPDFNDAYLLAITKANSYIDIITEQVLVTKYFWVRHLVFTADNRQLTSEYQPSNLVSGVIGSATGAIDADALTATSTTVNGVTTIEFSDGTSFTVNDGNTAGVVPIFASNVAGDSQSYTQGSLPYVNYYEYTNTKPTLPVAGLTWVKYIGEDGDSQGVVPIYADSAAGLNATFIFNNQEYINFYEWASPETSPTTVPPGLTYVKYIGADADALTATSTTVNGVTTIEFSDGTSFTINDGDTAGVVPIFASNVAGDSQSYTQGSLPYVNYYEYTNTKPTLPVAGLTWVKYIGEDGDSQGVVPIYADSAAGLNATFIFNNQEYVNFYEWASPETSPTTVPPGLTYVKYIGEDGVDGADGADGDPGATGAPGLRTAQGYLYYESTGAAPSAPAGTLYTWSSGLISGTGIGTGLNIWTNSARPQDAASTNTYYALPYIVLEQTAQSITTNASYGTVSVHTNFQGVVSFSGSNLVAGATVYDPAVVVNAGTTTINGGKITTGSIDAQQLTISANSAGQNSSIYFDGTNNRIDIRDSTGTLRVRLGNLA